MKYKGQLKGFPQEVVERMLACQVEQGNSRDITVFEKDVFAADNEKGFCWDETDEGDAFWNDVINHDDFEVFFKKYPKKLTNTYELW